MQGVRHVLELKKNLTFLRMLDAKDYEYKVGGGVLKVKMGSMVIMKGNLVHRLYLLQGNTLVGIVATVSEENQSQASLWHKRLGHISEGGLRELSKQKLL